MTEKEIIAIYLLGYEDGSSNLTKTPDINYILEHLKAFMNGTSK